MWLGEAKTYTAGGSGGCLSGHLALERQRALLGNMSDSLGWPDGSLACAWVAVVVILQESFVRKLRGKAGSALTICNLANKYLRNLRAKQR